jgi:predicted nucleic-acid-binding protein
MTTAVDTNVLIRLVVRDHAPQFHAAQKIMEAGRVFIPESVLLETEWALRSIYKFPAPDIRQALRGILGLKNVAVADPHKIARALDWHEAGMDFADALHLASSGHLGHLKTFDKDFVKRAKGISSCKVTHA